MEEVAKAGDDGEADFCDVPPLEDMSELLEQVQQLQRMKERKGLASSTSSSSSSSSSSLSSSSKGLVKPEDKPKVSKGDSIQENKSKTPTQNKSTSRKPDSFAGMKKGFLFGSAPKASTKPSSKTPKACPQKEPLVKGQTTAVTDGPEDIPLIKPQGDGAHNGAQRIQEVQDALKASAPLLENKDWVNDQLLSKIEKHPRLARQLSDPRFSQAMSMFQSNPQGAMNYFQDNPDIQDFFQDFCGILGDHFTSIGSTSSAPPASTAPKVSPVQEVKVQDKPGMDMTVSRSTDPKQATAADEAKMRDIMSDPEVVKAFGHPQTRLLFEALQTNPDLAQRCGVQATHTDVGQERASRLC